MKDRNQMSNDQWHAPYSELGDQFTSQADMVEAPYHRHRRDSDNKSRSNESGSDSEDEKSANNEDLLRLIRKGSSKQEIENAFSKKGVNIDYQNTNGDTPLHVAVRKGNQDIVGLLINKGAKVTIPNKKGKTPLNLVEEQFKKKPNDSNWKEIKASLEQVQPGSSGVKRPSDNTDTGADPKRTKTDLKRKPSEGQSSNPTKRPRTDPSLDPSPTYAASGVKRALDGTIYQSKLLMLFVKRAIGKGYDFRLATEMNTAEKFDDVVFKYEDQGKWTYRFLQAKHKQNPQRDKISVNELKTNKDDNFSLQKYFVSFCKIKENSLFQGGDLKDFIIATNTDFDFEINRKYKKDGQERKNSKERNDLIEKWKNFFEFKNLSNADKILYFGKGEKTGQFKKDAQTKAAIEIKSAIEKNIQEIEKNLKVKYNKALDDELKSLKHIVNNNFTNNIGDFLERLTFITNYPSERELGDFIKNELGKEFDLLNADLVSDSFEREMLDFLKSYDKGKAKFYSWKDGEEFFKAIKEKINTLMISGLSKVYPEKLRAYGIRFKKNLKGLKDFLSFHKQIFHVSTPSRRLSAIKVLESLEDSGKYRAHDSYIFMRLRTLLLQETQEYVINSFGKQGSHDLLVIECQDKTQGDTKEIAQLYSQLALALNNSSKKIILIAPGEDTLAGKFKDSQEGKYQKEDDKTSFEDLDEDSQKKILQKRVNFQGKDISLNRLIDKNSGGEIIDQGSLSRLLEGEKIAIGDEKAFASIGYVKDYYIERAFHRQRIKPEVLKEKAGSELFFITGANKGNLTGLDVKEKDIHTWEDGKTYDKGIVLPSSGQNVLEQGDENNKEIFQKLGKNVHWLEYQNGHLAWRASKGKLSALEKYIDKNYVSDGKSSLGEKDFSKPDPDKKVVIVANDPGVGKSTVLTSLANKMKEQSGALWVVRVNLNDYAVGKEKPQSLHNIKFQEGKTEEAIEFVSKMAVPGDSNDTDIQLQRNLFKSGIKDDQNPKIAILFDGFDEISPSYKRNTTKLIKALKGSNVTQLWVTTRVHEKADLEKELESPAYILNPLAKEEQEEFLSRFWKWSLKLSKEEDSKKAYKKICEHLKEIKSSLESLSNPSDKVSIEGLKNRISKTLQKHPSEEDPSSEQLESLQKTIDEKDENNNYKLDFSAYAKVLLDQWKASIRDTEKAFTNVPLNLRMLAEVVFEKKFQLPKNLGLFDLYDGFIEIKLNIYNQEKAKTTSGNQAADVKDLMYSDKLGKIHCELALKELFRVVRLCQEEKRPGKRPTEGWYQIPFFTFSLQVLHLKNSIVR